MPLVNYWYSAEIAAQFQTENADFFLFEKTSIENVSQNIYNFRYLITEYMRPSMVFALISAICLLAFIYLLVYRYIVRINPLCDVGGKE